MIFSSVFGGICVIRPFAARRRPGLLLYIGRVDVIPLLNSFIQKISLSIHLFILPARSSINPRLIHRQLVPAPSLFYLLFFLLYSFFSISTVYCIVRHQPNRLPLFFSTKQTEVVFLFPSQFLPLYPFRWRRICRYFFGSWHSHLIPCLLLVTCLPDIPCCFCRFLPPLPSFWSMNRKSICVESSTRTVYKRRMVANLLAALSWRACVFTFRKVVTQPHSASSHQYRSEWRAVNW